MAKTTNRDWGFFGTLNSHLGDGDTQKLYAQAVDSLMSECGISEEDAIVFLDSRSGRHFADWVLNEFGDYDDSMGLFKAVNWDGTLMDGIKKQVQAVLAESVSQSRVIKSAKTKEQSIKIQKHILEHHDSYEDMISNMQHYQKEYGPRAAKEWVEGGGALIYYDDQREFLTDLYNTPPEDQDKYDDDVVWKRYISLIQMEWSNILRNPQGGGKNYIAQAFLRPVFDGGGIINAKKEGPPVRGSYL